MRILSLAFLLTFGLSVSAQSPAVSDLFQEGARQANAGRFDDAIKTYRTVLTAAENEYLSSGYRARLHYNIGVCYFRTNRFDLAANHFKFAILLKTDYALAHQALGKAKIRD